jgi:hypothetical protein
MSKELTEKWKNDKLSGWYYCEREVLFKGNTVIIPMFLHKMNETEYRSFIIEVLDKVPDYDEYKQMEEQINNLQKMLEYECSKRCELEAQLAEANYR